MGLWAGIKYALNSTLGTDNFLPLDTLIKNQLTLYASDTPHRVLLPKFYHIVNPRMSKTSILPVKFTPINNGSCKIYFQFTHARYNDTNSGCSMNDSEIRIYKNNSIMTTINSNIAAGLDSLYPYTTEAFAFSAGDVFTFELYTVNGNSTYSSRAQIEDLKILGSVAPGIFIVNGE